MGGREGGRRELEGGEGGRGGGGREGEREGGREGLLLILPSPFPPFPPSSSFLLLPPPSSSFLPSRPPPSPAFAWGGVSDRRWMKVDPRGRSLRKLPE